MDDSPNRRSPLLQLIEQLSESWWSDCMMPHFARDAAANLTQTCKQLRDICQRSVTYLAFNSYQLEDTWALQRAPQHFPSCKQISVTLTNMRAAVLRLPLALDVLTKLTSVEGLCLHFNNGMVNHDPYAMAPALHAVASWLSLMRYGQDTRPFSVRVRLCKTFPGQEVIWECFGRLLPATTLQVTAGEFALDFHTSLYLSALKPLTKLQSLVIDLGSVVATESQDYSFLSGMSQLTQLHLPLASDVERKGLTSISSCTTLCDLVLDGYSQDAELSHQECAAIAQLVQLTSLQLVNASLSSPNFSFLSDLQQLKDLYVTPLSVAALPTLARLTQLTYLGGTWQQLEGDANDVVAEFTGIYSVQQLEAGGTVPFKAFPELRDVVQNCTWQPADFISMSCHCQHVTEVGLTGGDFWHDNSSMSASLPSPERVSAIKSLAALKHLHTVAFAANDNAEVAALCGLQNLQALCIVLPAHSSCSILSLVQVAALRQLQRVTLVILNESYLRHDVAEQLLLALSHTVEVWLRVPEHEYDEYSYTLDRTEQALEADGLQTPDIRLEVI